jgi:chemotaxis protein MotA
MDITTIVGVLSGFGLVFLAISLGSGIGIFFDAPSLMITVGGACASTLLNYSIKQITDIFNVVRKAFIHKLPEHPEVIGRMVALAEKARKEGILALEAEVQKYDDDFLRNGVQLIVDGVESDTIREILNTELSFLKERHKIGQGVLNSLATYAPAFGMIGTLIGLVQMLKNLDDPSKIGPGMAVALLTTFYGSIMANLVFLPMAGKLKVRSQEEVLIKELTIEGIMSVQSGDNPRIIATKLKAFISPKLRSKVSK